MRDQPPHGGHLPAFARRPVRPTPAIAVPARLFRRILLREGDDNVVRLAPRTEAAVRDERVVEAEAHERQQEVQLLVHLRLRVPV